MELEKGKFGPLGELSMLGKNEINTNQRFIVKNLWEGLLG
jgi:hypothetical protein